MHELRKVFQDLAVTVFQHACDLCCSTQIFMMAGRACLLFFNVLFENEDLFYLL